MTGHSPIWWIKAPGKIPEEAELILCTWIRGQLNRKLDIKILASGAIISTKRENRASATNIPSFLTHMQPQFPLYTIQVAEGANDILQQHPALQGIYEKKKKGSGILAIFSVKLNAKRNIKCQKHNGITLMCLKETVMTQEFFGFVFSETGSPSLSPRLESRGGLPSALTS